jgi:hypothetical protein
MTKKERKKYGLLSPKIALIVIEYLGHGLCEFGEFTYNKDTIQNTFSSSLVALIPIDADLFHRLV